MVLLECLVRIGVGEKLELKLVQTAQSIVFIGRSLAPKVDVPGIRELEGGKKETRDLKGLAPLHNLGKAEEGEGGKSESVSARQSETRCSSCDANRASSIFQQTCTS